MNAEILLTLKLNQQLFADPKRITLLKQIALKGSISQGAKQAQISYKTAWDAVDQMNQLAKHSLVERVTGGKGGGGAIVTSYGQRLIQLYELLEQIQHKAFAVLQDDSLPLNSLLGAIARFSLQTSARNQLFATVEQIDNSGLMEFVTLVLNDGQTRLYAALTQHSGERLQLIAGREVLALIKAPWINITLTPNNSDNQLMGYVVAVTRATHNSEILVEIAANQILCANISNDLADPMQLTIGQQIYASFSADSVIIAALL